MQRAGQRDVVDVVAGSVRQRTFLSPSRHASVNQAGIARETVVGAQAEPLGYAGPEAFDQCVGFLDQPQHGLNRFGPFEIERHRAPAAIEQAVFRIHRDAQTRVRHAIDA